MLHRLISIHIQNARKISIQSRTHLSRDKTLPNPTYLSEEVSKDARREVSGERSAHVTGATLTFSAGRATANGVSEERGDVASK